MKKLLYILLILPLFSFGQQGGPTINQIQANFETGGIWKKQGIAINGGNAPVYPGFDDANTVQEPTVIYEGTPQLLTNTTGSVFKMWYTDGYSTTNIMYAESLDGITWVKGATVVLSSHDRGSVYKNGSTYYLLAANQANTALDLYTSTNGYTGWSLNTANLIVKGGVGWRQNAVTNNSMYFDSSNSTWYVLVEGLNGTLFQIGLYSGSSLTSLTEYGSNPVISLSGFDWGGPYLTKVGSNYICWVHGTGSSSLNGSQLYRFSSSNMTSWTAANSGSPVLTRSTEDEGVNTSVGLMADPTLCEANGKTYIWYTGGPNGSTNTYANIKVAIANMTMANLILTNEGDGGKTPYYSLNQSMMDNRYILNTSTAQLGQIILKSSNGYLMQQNLTNANNYGALLENELLFSKSGGVTNSIIAGSGGFTNSSYGSYTFITNTVGTSASSSIDASGDFLPAGYLQTTGSSNYIWQRVAGITSLNITGHGGFYAQNTTAATSGVPIQYSPPFILQGAAWNTGSSSSYTNYVGLQALPVSGSTPSIGIAFVTAANFLAASLTEAGAFKSAKSIGTTEITFSSAPASPSVGDICNFSDSTVNTWGATVAGGGTNHVAARWNGTNWTVIGI